MGVAEYGECEWNDEAGGPGCHVADGGREIYYICYKLLQYNMVITLNGEI